MALFLPAVRKTLQFEGGYSNDPQDPGGATKYGITQRDMPDVNIQDITEEDAAKYYQDRYWKPLYSEITSQEVASKIFDTGVLAGVGTAVKLLQNALGVPVDGSFGPNTLAAANEAGDAVLGPYKQKLCEHYQNLVVHNPNLGKFLGGWLRRANS